MNLSSKIMAYWVCIFAAVVVANQFEVLQRYNLDEKSLFWGFVAGALLVKLAPRNDWEAEKRRQQQLEDKAGKADKPGKKDKK